MGFNTVADQFKKWKRNSYSQEDLPHRVSVHTEHDLEERQKAALRKNGMVLETPMSPPASASPKSPTATPPSPTSAKTTPEKPHCSIKEASTRTHTNKTNNSSNKAKKHYPPSPDTYLQGIGDYTFIRQIGHGKFSRVMLSYHYATKKQVAIKIIDKRQHDYRVLSRLTREISLMEVLDHPNIVQLYETYETTDSLFIVMEYIAGQNLEEYLAQRGGRLNESEAKRIFRQMVAAMDYCHSRWVVHRDLKAPNILLTEDCQVKVADFGLGNRYGRRRLKTICGSMLYYSPEIINGQGYTGPEVDCWCLGVSLYRMTVGEEPFARARTVGDLRKDVTLGNFSIPKFINPALKDTILKCMSVDRTKRTRLHIALRNDAWLTENGMLPGIFTYGTYIPRSTSAILSTSVTTNTEDNRLSMQKKEKDMMKFYQMKDLEEEKHIKKHVKKSVICHPKNPSIYYTSVIPHSMKPEDTFANSEAHRHIVFQKLNDISHQIHLAPAVKTSNKSPIRHLLCKLKSPAKKATTGVAPNGMVTSTLPTTIRGGSLRKSTSNLSLTQLYQRVAKDQVHYYTFQLTPELSMRLLQSGNGEAPTATVTARSLYSSQQDETMMMLILKAICDMMGITYHRDKGNRLLCVMALKDYYYEKQKQQQQEQEQDQRRRSSSSSSFYKLGMNNGKRRDSKITSSNQSLRSFFQHTTSSSAANNTGLSSMTMMHSQYFVNGNNNSQTSSHAKMGKFKRATSQMFSSVFPYHSSTLVQQQKQHIPTQESNHRLSIKCPPFPQQQPETLNPPASSEPTDRDSLENCSDTKPGITVFAMEIIPLSKNLENRMVAVKLSKLDGSSKVFRIACGWITGVVGQKLSATQLAENTSMLLDSAENDISTTLLTDDDDNDMPASPMFPMAATTAPPLKQRLLARPKSFATFSTTTTTHTLNTPARSSTSNNASLFTSAHPLATKV